MRLHPQRRDVTPAPAGPPARRGRDVAVPARLRIRASAAAAGLLAWSLAAGGCGWPGGDDGGARGSRPAGPQEPVAPLEIENSGRTLDGVYELEAPAPPVAGARIAFTRDGSFARTRIVEGFSRAREDAGTYVIDGDGRLVLFVERIGEARLNVAAPSVYRLEVGPSESITLEASDGRVDRFTKSAEPARLSAGGAP